MMVLPARGHRPAGSECGGAEKVIIAGFELVREGVDTGDGSEK